MYHKYVEEVRKSNEDFKYYGCFYKHPLLRDLCMAKDENEKNRIHFESTQEYKEWYT